MLVGHVLGGRVINDLAAGGGQRDQHAAPVAWIGLASDVTSGFKPVQALGRAGGGQHERVGEVRRAHLEGRPGPAQGGEDVVPAWFEAAGGVDRLKAILDLAG